MGRGKILKYVEVRVASILHSEKLTKSGKISTNFWKNPTKKNFFLKNTVKPQKLEGKLLLSENHKQVRLKFAKRHKMQ